MMSTVKASLSHHCFSHTETNSFMSHKFSHSFLFS